MPSSPAAARRSLPARLDVTCDRDEARSGIPEGLAMLGARVQVARLQAGDYDLGYGTIVERKRVIDLHTAVTHERFWPQIARLRDACSHPYLLIEGTDIDRGPLSPASVRSLCLAVIAKGIPMLRSDQQSDSVAWLFRLAVRTRQAAGAGPGGPPFTRRARKPAGVAPAEAVLAAVPGISPRRARALLERFGTLGDLIAAGPDAWVEVEGVGRARAEALSAALSRAHA